MTHLFFTFWCLNKACKSSKKQCRSVNNTLVKNVRKACFQKCLKTAKSVRFDLWLLIDFGSFWSARRINRKVNAKARFWKSFPKSIGPMGLCSFPVRKRSKEHGPGHGPCFKMLNSSGKTDSSTRAPISLFSMDDSFDIPNPIWSNFHQKMLVEASLF